MKHKIYLTTGEFAKLCHTTKHTLFHYDDIGLFTPAYIDENGYRYYHVLQYDSFLTIAQLQTGGMSLSAIKGYMQERSPQRMAELCQQQEQQLSRQIEELKRIKTRISTQKNNILHVLRCTEEYFFEQQEKQYLLCSDTVSPADDYTMTAAIGDLIYTSDGRTSANTLGMLCPLPDTLRSEDYPFRFYVYGTASKQRKAHIKPEGTYLATYHHGTYETLYTTYARVVSYAKEQLLPLDNWLYVETIIGDWAVQQPQDYIIKVSIKVQEK